MSDLYVGIMSLALGAARGLTENDMQRERQRRAGQDDRRGARRTARVATPPIVMAARRPRSDVAPPAEPAPEPEAAGSDAVDATESRVTAGDTPPGAPGASPPARRAARIVAAPSRTTDAGRIERERLLARFMASQGRAMISRAADECRRAGVEFPHEQAVQLQLLEHVDESLARGAIAALGQILAAEAPAKRPILLQRLQRLEDASDEEATRTAAAELRRSLRG
jgi:hypothetical protein